MVTVSPNFIVQSSGKIVTVLYVPTSGFPDLETTTVRLTAPSGGGQVGARYTALGFGSCGVREPRVGDDVVRRLIRQR